MHDRNADTPERRIASGCLFMQLVGESTVAALSSRCGADPVREFRFGFGLNGLSSPEPGCFAGADRFGRSDWRRQ
jgi:hypothetical protein